MGLCVFMYAIIPALPAYCHTYTPGVWHCHPCIFVHIYLYVLEYVVFRYNINVHVYNTHSYVGVTIGRGYKYSSEPYNRSREMRNVSRH